MKKLIVLTVLIFSFASMVYAAGVNGDYKGNRIVKVTYEGEELLPDDVPGQIIDGRTMVPLGLLRKAGVTVEWDQKTLTANVKLPRRTVPVLIQSQLDELKKAVYLVHAEYPDPSKVSQGSGFIVDGMLITNYHVGGDSAWTKALIDGNWQQTSSYAFADKGADLMGFKVSGGRSLPIATELPQPGDPVYTVGYPGGALTVSEGEVNAVYEYKGNLQITTSAHTEGGSSGGVLLNGKGEVVGIIKAGVTTEQIDFSVAIPIKYVQDLNK